MTEVGPVAFETPGGARRLRVILESYYAEVIDPETKKPSLTGEGELVLTTVGRTGCPLFRYRTGDLVGLKARPARMVFPCWIWRAESWVAQMTWLWVRG